MVSHKSNKSNIFVVILIISVVIILCIIIGILLYKLLKKKPVSPSVIVTSSPSSESASSASYSESSPSIQKKVRILPDRNNKVILIDGEFHRVDPGLYNKPYNYPGVVHRGPELVDLNS